MKTFVINKYKIKADTITDAVKVAKILQKDNNQTQYAIESKEEADAMLKKMGISFGKTVKAAGTEDIHYFKGDEKVAIYSPVRKFLYVFSNPVTVDSIKDDDEEDLAFLTEEERKAVEEYKQAIANTSNPKLLELYKHILEDEMEHIQELQNGEID